jgi:hypothetical protein
VNGDFCKNFFRNNIFRRLPTLQSSQLRVVQVQQLSFAILIKKFKRGQVKLLCVRLHNQKIFLLSIWHLGFLFLLLFFSPERKKEDEFSSSTTTGVAPQLSFLFGPFSFRKKKDAGQAKSAQVLSASGFFLLSWLVA